MRTLEKSLLYTEEVNRGVLLGLLSRTAFRKQKEQRKHLDVRVPKMQRQFADIDRFPAAHHKMQMLSLEGHTRT